MESAAKRAKTQDSSSDSEMTSQVAKASAGRLGSGTFFLVCDVQVTDRFRSVIHNMDHVIASSSFLVEAAKLLDVKCIFTEQNPDKLGATCEEISTDGFPVYPKTKFSMLTPEVRAELAKPKTEERTCVLFGIESHVCVYQTAMDLLAEKEFDVHIVTDAVSSSRPIYRDTALQRLKEQGAYLTTSETVLFDIMRDSSHPNFRQISKLIKEHNQKLAKLQSTL
ncbi:Isochorismatase domain-containing protein 1 [Hondaea fermentalgiana]|uniref:Isochorismatase domain-containing protein 1 n=1 Tax=Hondaea fermentalgiana TaxID=2315210 RepID=A0A2R5GD54_9STRA|nr:Isochorismatase domain-containing protein 1 [Hondaea fermentalgiana]|eukprot:GBG25724.1 Isochorismatase domain-containing protein 1 [Hondaea fermentalgiana]